MWFVLTIAALITCVTVLSFVVGRRSRADRRAFARMSREEQSAAMDHRRDVGSHGAHESARVAGHNNHLRNNWGGPGTV